MEPLDQVHLLHQVEGHAGERLAVADGLEVKRVELPAVNAAKGLGQLQRGTIVYKQSGTMQSATSVVGTDQLSPAYVKGTS